MIALLGKRAALNDFRLFFLVRIPILPKEGVKQQVLQLPGLFCINICAPLP